MSSVGGIFCEGSECTGTCSILFRWATGVCGESISEDKGDSSMDEGLDRLDGSKEGEEDECGDGGGDGGCGSFKDLGPSAIGIVSPTIVEEACVDK